MKNFEAVCTWGQAKDVCLLIKDHPVILLEEVDKSLFTQGSVRKAEIEFTAAEARELAAHLLIAAAQADELEKLSFNF